MMRTRSCFSPFTWLWPFLTTNGMSNIEERSPSVCRIAVVGRAGNGKSTVSRVIRRKPVDNCYNPTPCQKTKYTADGNCEVTEYPSWQQETELPLTNAVEDYHIVVFVYRYPKKNASKIDEEWVQSFKRDYPQKHLVAVGIDAPPEKLCYSPHKNHSTVLFERASDPSPLLSAIADYMKEDFPRAADNMHPRK